MKKNSIVSLLRAVEKGQGYIMDVREVIKTKSVVFIKIDDPPREVKMTREAYSKIEPFLNERRHA